MGTIYKHTELRRARARGPRGRTALERAKIGREVEDARTRIGEVISEIANTPQGLAANQ